MGKSSLPLILALIVALGAYLFINMTLDDPFISFRYADNLAAGNGLVYNAGERVEGFSNPTWVLIMSAFSLFLQGKSPLGMLWIAKALGIILTIATVLIVYSAEQKLTPEKQPIASIFLALNPCIWAWSVGGLETPFCMLLMALVIREEAIEKNSMMIAVWMGILSITRPEMPALLLVFLILKWRSKWRSSRDRLGFFAFAIIPLILYLAFRLLYFGDLLPNTFYSKSPDQWLSGMRYYLVSMGSFFYGWSMVPLLLLGIISSRRPGKLLGISFVAIYSLLVIVIGGDWMPAARFFVNIAPAWAWIVAEGFDRLAEVVRTRKDILLQGILLPILTVGAIFVTGHVKYDFVLGEWPWEKLSWESPVYPSYLEMGDWLRDNASPDDVVALGEAGLVPFVGKVRIIDCFGLMDKHIARLRGKFHMKFDADYAMSKNPDYILLLGEYTNDVFESRFNYCRELNAYPGFSDRYELAQKIGDLWLFKRQPE